MVSSSIHTMPNDELVNLSHALIWRGRAAGVNRGVWFRRAIWRYFLILLVRGTRLQGISSRTEPDSNMGRNQAPRDKGRAVEKAQISSLGPRCIRECLVLCTARSRGHLSLPEPPTLFQASFRSSINAKLTCVDTSVRAYVGKYARPDLCASGRRHVSGPRPRYAHQSSSA